MSDKLLFVDGNGRYCCRGKAMRIGKGCACGYTVTLMNTGPLDLTVYPTGDTDEGSMVHSTLAEGTTLLTDAGTFILDTAALCEKLDGTVAPEDPAEHILIGCCEIDCDAIGDVAICGKLQAILDAIGDLSLEVDMSAVIDKLCTLLDDDSTIALKLCSASDCLELMKATNDAWCAADAIFQAANLACLAEIKANTSAIVGIETSLGQIGCTEDAEGNITGHVLVCKQTNAEGEENIVVHWFGLNGEHIVDFEGGYVACTNLKELLDVLHQIRDCPKSVTMQCFRKPTRCVGYDNGRTPGSSTNDGGTAAGFVHKDWPMTVKGWMVNGAEVGEGASFGPFAEGGAGWTEQLQAWADFMNENMPTPKCTAAFGVLPAPTWRYTKITCHDLHTQFGPLRLVHDETGVCYTLYPLFDEISWETLYRYDTVDCDGNKATVWCDNQGNTVGAPKDIDCWYSCDQEALSMISGPAGPDCGFPNVVKACDDAGEFYIMTYTCDGEKVTQYFTAESWEAGNPEEYKPSGAIVNCLTGEPIEGKSLADALIVKQPTGALIGADYTRALCYTPAGRPVPNVPWSWIDNTDPNNQVTVVDAPDLGSFIEQVESLGYEEFTVGENHYVCPVPANWNGAGSHFFEADGNTVTKPEATPIASIEGAPAKVAAAAEAFCALRTEDCGNANRDDLLQQLLDKACLQYDATANPNACGSPVPENGLDKEALTLTLDGDVGAKYPAGTTIAMKDANGNICGNATSTGQTELVDGKTVITIEECEMAAGKEPAVIATAAPVLQTTATAVKTLVRTQVAVRKLTPVKEEGR